MIGQLSCVMAVAFLLAVPASSQTAQPECVPPLDDLYYPPVLVRALIQDPVRTTFTFNSEGRVTEMRSTGHPLLALAVEQSLRSAPSFPECAGQVIAVGVYFRLDDTRGEKPIVNKLSPTEYEVLSPHPMIDSSISDPAWIFSRRGRFLHHLKAWLAKLK